MLLMTEIAQHMQPELQPFMNPEYWDGHILGNECDSPGNAVIESPMFRGQRFVKQVIGEHFSRSNPTFSIENPGRGMVFDPNSHDPGTVVHFDIERLVARNPEQTGLLQHEQLPLAQRPTDLPANIMYGQDEGRVFISQKQPHTTYMRQICWGVVVAHGDNNAVAYSSAALMGRSRHNGKFISPTVIDLRDGIIEIGQTVHQPHSLKRTNMLQVCTNGSVERRSEPGRLQALLGRFALGGS